MGKDPEKATLDDFLAAVDKIGRASDSGQIRGFTGNEYTKDITKGDSWLIIGWSGDAVQLKADNPNIEFIPPETGVHLWTDNMQIPVGAPHAFTAEKFIDFVYQPEIQAPIAAYVNYICPVNGVKEILEKDDPELAKNQLIFPSEETLDDAFIFPQLKPDEERELDEAFQRGDRRLGKSARGLACRPGFASERCRTSCCCPGWAGWWSSSRFRWSSCSLESLKTGTIDTGYSLTWEFSNYTNAL